MLRTSITRPVLTPARCTVCGSPAMQTVDTKLCWVCQRLRATVDIEIEAVRKEFGEFKDA